MKSKISCWRLKEKNIGDWGKALLDETWKTAEVQTAGWFPGEVLVNQKYKTSNKENFKERDKKMLKKKDST